MVHPGLTTIRRGQLGVWTRGQAVEVGVAYSTIRRWARAGRAVELFPGVLVEAGQPVDWQVRAVAARLWLGGDALLARSTAGRVHGLRLPRRCGTEGIHLVVGTRHPVPPPGITVHRTIRPLDEIGVDRGPHRLTSVEATTCDLAGQLLPRELRRLVAHAVRTGTTTPDLLAATAERHGRFRGRVAHRQVLAELSPAEHHTASELESLFLRVCTSWELAPDVVNHEVRDATGRVRRLDAAYLAENVPVELDSWLEHGTLVDWNDDRRRAADIELMPPWRSVVRFSWDDLTRYPDQAMARLALALRNAGTTRDLPAVPALRSLD